MLPIFASPELGIVNPASSLLLGSGEMMPAAESPEGKEGAAVTDGREEAETLGITDDGFAGTSVWLERSGTAWIDDASTAELNESVKTAEGSEDRLAGGDGTAVSIESETVGAGAGSSDEGGATACGGSDATACGDSEAGGAATA